MISYITDYVDIKSSICTSTHTRVVSPCIGYAARPLF